MIRTFFSRFATFWAAVAVGVAQEPAKDPAGKSQDITIAQVVENLQKSEQAAKSFRLGIRSEGSLPGAAGQFTTQGTLRVLRGAQLCIQTAMSYEGGDGLNGRMETVRTGQGILMLEHSPSSGENLVRIDAALMADIEWAAELLQRGDVTATGSAGRAMSPMGSSMLREIDAQYELKLLSRTPRDGVPGYRFGGDLRGKERPPESTPLCDRVELFLREPDFAVMSVVYLQMGKPVQRIEITELQRDVPMQESEFTLDVGARKPRDIREHPPMWQPFERLLKDADVLAEEKKLPPRPSKR